MRRTLVVTNDFPPVVGGIQTYLADFVGRLPAQDIDIFTHTPADSAAAAQYDAASPYRIHRHHSKVLLPTRCVSREMVSLIREREIEAVWFGASAPLGLLGPAARAAGATRIIASTYGHELGWALLPPTRAALRRIFRSTDVVTYLTDYTRDRLAPVIPAATTMVRLPSGIDTERFQSDPAARAELRERYELGDAPTVVCVSRLVPRKGQDQLIEAWPEVAAAVPGARLVIVGKGSYADHLARLKRSSPVGDLITLTGEVPGSELAAHYALGEVFAMPCRTRNFGADVEGLGIVYLEAAAVGMPVIAGDSGGAPETVVDGVTGLVVDGTDRTEIAAAAISLLTDPERAAAMGAAGRGYMESDWTWPHLIERLQSAIDG